MNTKSLVLASFLLVSNAYAAISRDTAEQIAQRQVPGASIVGGGLEKARDGRYVWTMELATRKSRNLTEVVIDAESGKVLSVRLESPAEQVGKTQPL